MTPNLSAPTPVRFRQRVRAAVAGAAAHPAMRWLSPLVGVAMVMALFLQIRDIGWETLARIWPRDPLFYLIFLASYLAPVFSELEIYKRLWGIGRREWPMFLRKRVMNEVLIGYSGEAYAVFWARRRGVPGAEALAAVKDVNIVSAVIGILSTILLLAMTLMFQDGVRLASAAVAASGPAVGAALALMAAPLLVMLFQSRLFSLPKPALGYAAQVHSGRVAFGVLTTIGMWAVAMPGIGGAVWLTLAAWRAVVQRLPLISSKELLFVNLAILALGVSGRDVAALLAATAALTLLAHLLSMIVSSMIGRGAQPVPA